MNIDRRMNRGFSGHVISDRTDEIIELRAQVDDGSRHRLTRKMAVLFTDVKASSAYFKTHGDAAGRIMLQKHNNILFPVIEEHKGVIVKTIGDSIMASFKDPIMAIRAAMEMQERLLSYNENRTKRNQIHIRIGVNFGDIIVEDNDIFGNVVNMTSRILSLAKPDHIFVSQNVYNILRETEGILFRSVNIEVCMGESEKIKVYEVMWREDIPLIQTFSVMSLSFMNQRHGREKDEDSMKAWAESCFDLVIPIIYRNTNKLVARSDVELVSIFENPVVPVEVAREVVTVVERYNSEGSGKEPVEFEIFINTGGVEIDGDGEEDSFAEIADARSNFRNLFRPNQIYISKNTHDFLRDVEKIESEPAAVSAEGRVLLYQIKSTDSESKEDVKLFQPRKRLGDGNYPKCFYCGSKKHPVNHCPSKTIWDSPDSLAELGHLSFKEINVLFVDNIERIIRPHEPTQQTDEAQKQEGGGPAFQAFYELSRVFQLHFLKRIWLSKAKRWSEIEKRPREVKEEGGGLWLALDSIRVSKLERAEALLQAEEKRHPNDYRIHTAFGFLNIERGNPAQALGSFEEAMICANSMLQKGYIALLAFRVCDVTNRFNEARQKIDESLEITPNCPEARYQKAALMIRMGEYQRGVQELRSLIKGDPSSYANVLLDPFLASVADQIDIFLLGLFEDARDKAIEIRPKAEIAVGKLKEWLGPGNEKYKNNIADLDEISAHMESNSYLGFIDAAALGENIFYRSKMILTNKKNRVKEKLSALVSGLMRELAYIKSHPCRKKLGKLGFSLKVISDEMSTAKSKTVFIETPEQLKEAQRIIRQLSEYSRGLIPVIKRLRRFERIQLALNASKKVSLFVIGGLAVGGIVFPLVTYYLAYFSSDFYSVIEKLWKHQGLAIFLGVMAGLISGIVTVLLKGKKGYIST